MIKVGKIKKGPVNKTDTSFTSKKVVIRAQNIKTTIGNGNGNESVEVSLLNRIRLNLVNCGHYNGNMRKDSTLNILKCIKEFPDLQAASFLASLDPIFVATFRQICDEEINVRSALLGLMNFIFEQVKRENLGGFFPKWIAFLNLSSSHIKPEIRKDSVRFISLTLKTQKILFIPYLHTLLPTLIPLVTQYPQRNVALPAFDCIMNLIDAYIEPFSSQKEADNLSKPLQSFIWKDNTSTPVNIVRDSPYSNSSTINDTKPHPIPEISLKALISHLGNLSISLWLDCAHLISTSSTSTNSKSSFIITKAKNSTANSGEVRQLQELLKFYGKLYKLTKVCGGDEDLFWLVMPVKLVKNYRAVIEGLIK